MADGSVVIGVGLDTADFARQLASLESQVSQIGARINQTMISSVAGNNIGTSFASSLQTLTQAALNVSAQVALIIDNMAHQCLTVFSAVGWEEGGRAAMSKIGDGITSGRLAVNTAFALAAADATSHFNNGSWTSIGHNIISGIAAGIRDAGGEVVAAIREVSERADSAVRDYYEIASPSALMRDEVGVMISRGMAEGILDGSGFVGNAMESVWSPTNSAGFGDISQRSGSVTQNIYLRDDDSSPYRTARRIRRESEAIFRL